MSETPNTPGPENPIPPNEPKPSGEAPPAAGEVMGDPADVEKNKVMALLAYIGILWLVPLLAAKDSPFAKYHANQGLVLFLAEVVFCVVVGCFSIFIHFIPYLGTVIWCCTCFVYPVISLAFLGYAIMGILNAVNGKMKPLPGIPDTLKIIK